MPAKNQLLITLRYYATGSFQLTDGDIFGVDQSTVNRIVHKISRAIAKLSSSFICFPTEREQEIQKVQFYDIARFPGIIGLIDGTHIRIEKPSTTHSELYRNRKSYFSINTQVMMDSQFRINDLVCRWYGSAHDSRILENSLLYERLENVCQGSWILRDSGYSCLRFLLTSFLCPSNQPERRYNFSHKKTRNLIERGFGIWKRRFPILKYCLRVKLENCPPIIVACAVLHNIAISLKEEEFLAEDMQAELSATDDNSASSQTHSDAHGNALRRTIVQRYFRDN